MKVVVAALAAALLAPLAAARPDGRAVAGALRWAIPRAAVA